MIAATDKKHEESNGKKPEHPETGPEVTVTINSVARAIHRGRQSVADIKAAGSVALADVLEQVIDGVLTPLANDGSVTIKGGEAFISHVADGGSA